MKNNEEIVSIEIFNGTTWHAQMVKNLLKIQEVRRSCRMR